MGPANGVGPALAHHRVITTHQHNSRYKVRERRACGEVGSQGICRETVVMLRVGGGGMP